MCDAPVAVDATVCLRCGVKFAAPETLEDELEDLGRAAIQEMVEEEFGEGKSVPAGAESEKKPDREPLPKPAPRPEPKPIPKKGLTNGLVFSRSPRSRAGMTNGLKGRTNGLRGRTNGLTNGMGRTNGLTNGMGRTNGLTNGLGRTNGLTNGLGRTNGLTNGLGRTNGLTNGLGRTNGLTNGLAGIRRMGLRSSGFRGMVRTAGWKLYVIPLVVVGLLLMPLFFVPPYSGPAYPIQIDGQFNDWASIATESMGAGGVPNPNVDVVRFGVVSNLGPVAFYVEVAGSILTGGGATPGTMDTVRIFVDIDGSASTGYRIFPGKSRARDSVRRRGPAASGHHCGQRRESPAAEPGGSWAARGAQLPPHPDRRHGSRQRVVPPSAHRWSQRARPGCADVSR